MKKAKFIAIKNQADSNTLELYFLDVIADSYDFWSDSVQSKVQEIIDKVNYYQPSKIKCIIDSVGGDAFVGLAIYNFLKNTSAKVEVEIIGIAGSIASVIAMAANKGKLLIARNAFMMIHKAEGVTGGTASQIRQGADLVDKFDEQIADIYSQRVGRTSDEIKALYENGDYWMTGDEAVSQGFADDTFNQVQNISVAARLSTEEYKNIPAAIRAQLKPETVENNPSFFQQQFDDMKKFFTDIVNSIKGIKPAENGNQQDLVNQIANAMNTPLEKVGDEIEATITNQVSAAMKDEAFTNALNATVKTAVENATKELSTKVTNLETAKTELEKKNGELEQEITNVKGGASVGNKDPEGPKPIGGFKK